MLKKKKQQEFDTSKEGYEYIGLHFTDEQYEDISNINLLMAYDMYNKGQHIPVHYIILVLKALGLLQTEKVDEICYKNAADYTREEYEQLFQRKYGKFKE